MQPLEIEKVELFLESVISESSRDWCGATIQQIEAVRALFVDPLPDEYEWFLRVMGKSLGCLSFAEIDLSIDTVLAYHREDQRLAERGELLIGAIRSDVVENSLLFLTPDIDGTGGRRVISESISSGARDVMYSSLREFLGYSFVNGFGLYEQSCVLGGVFSGGSDHVASLATPILRKLGFDRMLDTSAYCGLFVRKDCYFTTKCPLQTQAKIASFGIGGDSESELRDVIGHVASAGGLEVEFDDW